MKHNVHLPIKDITVRYYSYVFVAGCFFYLLYPAPIHAYVDPGTTGMLSQLLYVLFYAAIGLFIYLLRIIKRTPTLMGEYFSKLLKIKKHSS